MHGKSFPLLTGILLFLWGMPFLTADIVDLIPFKTHIYLRKGHPLAKKEDRKSVV